MQKVIAPFWCWLYRGFMLFKSSQPQVRLDPDVHAKLVLIQNECEWPVSMATLASYAVRKGLAGTKKMFAPTKKGKQP